MKYKCFCCNKEYLGNSYRLPLDDNNIIVNSGLNNQYQYKCPNCNENLVFMPIPKGEITKIDVEFFYDIKSGVIATASLIKNKGYNKATFKSLGFFPDQILAANYYNYMKNKLKIND